MRILLFLIPLFCSFSQSHASLLKPSIRVQAEEKNFKFTAQTHLQRQINLASQLEGASAGLKMILHMDQDGKIQKDLGSLEVQIDCAIGLLNKGIEASAAKIKEESLEFSPSFAAVPFRTKLKSLIPPITAPPQEQNEEGSTDCYKTSIAESLSVPHKNHKKPQSTPEENFKELQLGLDKLTKDLGEEFMAEVFSPWFQRNRLRISTKANFEAFPFQHALLLCVLETSLETAKVLNKECKIKSQALIVVHDNPHYTRSHVTWCALSAILASGMCDLTEWELPSYHAWAQPAFTLIKNTRIQLALKKHKIEVAKALYQALSQRSLKLDKRIDFFFYLMHPEGATRRYSAQLMAGKSVLSDCRKQTPLMWAAMFDHVNALMSILKTFDSFSNEDKNEEDKLLSYINEEDYKELAAVDYACLHSHITCIDLLMLAGSEAPRVTTLVRLVKKGNTEILESLLNHMDMPPEVEAAARENKMTSVMELLEKHALKKAAVTAPKLGRRRKNKNKNKR